MIIDKIKALLTGGKSKMPAFIQNPEMNYLEAYADYVNQRISVDPKEAIGGRWDEIGRLQFDFLIARGLKPNHHFLDIGCGTLRGGRHFIKYLDSGNYWGFDISQSAIDWGASYIQEIEPQKQVYLFHNMENLGHAKLQNNQFDFLFAQSVFTHLPPEIIEEYFSTLGNLMNKSSRFYFTYDESPSFQIEREVDYLYPKKFFTDLASKYHFLIRDCAANYPHPRDQKMIELTLIG